MANKNYCDIHICRFLPNLEIIMSAKCKAFALTAIINVSMYKITPHYTNMCTSCTKSVKICNLNCSNLCCKISLINQNSDDLICDQKVHKLKVQIARVKEIQLNVNNKFG